MSIASFSRDVNDRKKAAGQKGLGTLMETIGGGIKGAIIGGNPISAIAGAAGGFAHAVAPQPVKNVMDAMDVFSAWKNLQPKAPQSLTPDYMKMLR
jgi:outer membrane lipoprotein SlyB